jgi:TatD DNase family protein
VSLIDTHAHLTDPKFDSDVDEVIARANAAGVERIIVCGYDLESSRAAVELAVRFESVYATVGVHPHDAKSYSADIESAIEELSRAPKVLAIGEIGLDYHYDFSPRCAQVAAFEAQVELAAKLGLPIVVHSRESNDEALQVLAGRAGNIIAGVFHCFSGDVEFARTVLEMGFYIGIDGPVTYKASEKLRAVVEFCPLDRLLIETDCPYLTPVPHRGKRNEPAYVRYVAEEAARAKGISFEKLAEATTSNARRLFGLSKVQT